MKIKLQISEFITNTYLLLEQIKMVAIFLLFNDNYCVDRLYVLYNIDKEYFERFCK